MIILRHLNSRIVLNHVVSFTAKIGVGESGMNVPWIEIKYAHGGTEKLEFSDKHKRDDMMQRIESQIEGIN